MSKSPTDSNAESLKPTYNYNKWLWKANEDLDTAKLLRANNKYDAAIFYLQQAEEMLAKSILIAWGFVLTLKDDEMIIPALEKLLRGKDLDPKFFSHDWNNKLFRLFEVTSKSLFPKFNVQNQFKGLKEWFEDIRSTPNPSEEEIEYVLDMGGGVLELLDEEKFRRETYKQEVAEELKSVPRDVLAAFNVTFIQMIKMYSILMALAMLNEYLQYHVSLARYPNDGDTRRSFEYDETLPLVIKFNEIADMLLTFIDLAKSRLETMKPERFALSLRAILEAAQEDSNED